MKFWHGLTCAVVFLAVDIVLSCLHSAHCGYGFPDRLTSVLYVLLSMWVTRFSEKRSESVEVAPHSYTNHDWTVSSAGKSQQFLMTKHWESHEVKQIHNVTSMTSCLNPFVYRVIKLESALKSILLNVLRLIKFNMFVCCGCVWTMISWLCCFAIGVSKHDTADSEALLKPQNHDNAHSYLLPEKRRTKVIFMQLKIHILFLKRF